MMTPHLPTPKKRPQSIPKALVHCSDLPSIDTQQSATLAACVFVFHSLKLNQKCHVLNMCHNSSEDMNRTC